MVTGCSAGLGIETARTLHATGADVYITVRPSEYAQGQRIIEDIKASVPSSGRLELVLLDLSSQKSVQSAAEDFLRRSSNLNVLICNAGVMMCPKTLTAEGHEMHVGSNHLGHFLFFQLLKPLLLSSATPSSPSRVITVSSAGHRFNPIRFNDINFDLEDYDPTLAYGHSKTANVYMASSIERKYGYLNLYASSVHPGIILDTDLPRHQTGESLDSDFNLEEMMPLMKSIPQGAATTVWAAATTGIEGGKYLADRGECGPFREGDSVAAAGYAEHAYDEVAEERLWK